MQDTFQNLKETLNQGNAFANGGELNEAAHNLLGFFEILLQIDKEQEEKRDENLRSEHSIHQAR